MQTCEQVHQFDSIMREDIIKNYDVLKPRVRGNNTLKCNPERQSLHTFIGHFQFAGHSIGAFKYTPYELKIVLRCKIWDVFFSCYACNLYLF